LKQLRKNFKSYSALAWMTCLSLMLLTQECEASSLSLGGMSSSITSSFTSMTKLITAGSYLAGLAFSIGAIIKFKQHKDNPQSTPIGNPIALVFIAAALLFLPTILGIAGSTMFGAGGGTVAGPSGAVYKTS
jgi:intracellular multiplication protein IcmD